ncbi:MAG: malonyl-CoA synthase [Leptothrix sp. (in: b-proteobacteria)]
MPDAASADHNLYAALRAGFPADLDAMAIETDSGLRYSWGDLERASAMLANLLQSLEIAPGSRVAVQTEKSVEALLLYLATLRAGFVYLPLNNAYQAGELDYFIGNAEPAVVVCSGAAFPWLSKLAFGHGVAHVFTLNDDRSGTLLERAAHFSAQHAVMPRTPDDLAAILYTSGTTGRSKGAMLSHGNLLSNARTLKAFWDWRQPDPATGLGGDVLIHALPIFHVHGLFVAIHGALLNGSPMLWLARFDPKAVVERLPRATVFMGVPTLYVRLLHEAGLTREACAHMRLFISGSAPLLIETFRDWQTRTGHTILERYGMSETIMLTSNPCRPQDGEREARRLGGTVGAALPGVDVRVVASDAQPLPAGEIGDVQVRGPNVFGGYWRMPEKTAEEFTADELGQPWFKTGDVGRFDENGYLTIVGRSKDLIITGGYNVYPAEIEGYLNDLPGVAESAVIGVPHPDFGEAVVAVIVAKADGVLAAEALVAHLKQHIAGFKVPKRAFVVTELPRNAMGKVQKNLLRAEHQGLFSA